MHQWECLYDSRIPLFIDRHDIPGVTAQQLAEAHRADIEVEAGHHVHYHTYWFDPEAGSVFCLAEGPSREAVEAVHRDSHGLLASAIVELDASVPLNQFFGSIPSQPVGTAYSEPGMRVIVFTDMVGSVAQTHEYGDDVHRALLDEHDVVVREELTVHDGREVKHTGDGIMSAFNSAIGAVNFARSLQRRFHQRNEAAQVPFHICIGISAGEPVTNDNGDLFGAAVQMAARLCAAAEPGAISATVAVRELCVGKSVRFDNGGQLTLKGVPEPVQVFTVPWLE